MRRENYSVALERKCQLCGEGFIAISARQVLCTRDHFTHCSMCGEQIILDHSNLAENRGGYCDNICSALSQGNSPIPRKLIPQYKDIDAWAIAFKDAHGVKPTRHEFKEHFGVALPRTRYNPALFNLKKSSGWETKVQRYLKQCHPHLVIRPHHRQRLGNGRIMEIDLYIPSMRLGFEVQDEKTHSREREDEPSPFGGYKHGPSYHGEKVAGYAALGITVVEIWQGNIEDGSYKNIVDLSLAHAESPQFPW